MSHIYKLHYNGRKNAINAANKTIEAGQGAAGRKTPPQSEVVRRKTTAAQYFIDLSA